MQQANKPTVLQVTGLNFSYPDKKLFTDFSADFPAGVTLLCGGDGRGKTTLLRLLAGTLKAGSGRLSINGIALHTQPENDNAKVFWAEPRTEAFDPLTAQSYFELQRRNHAGFNDAVLATVLDGLGLTEHLHKNLFMLSTGSKRKLFIAAAFASGAAITLLDEPFAAVDAASISFMLNWLKNPDNVNHRVWVIADYAAPQGLPLLQIIDLGD